LVVVCHQLFIYIWYVLSLREQERCDFIIGQPLTTVIFADNPELTKEAADVFIWCLVQNPECYKQWVSYSDHNLDVPVFLITT